MDEEEKQFVREEYKILQGYLPETGLEKQFRDAELRLLSLLIESEGMRAKAEFWNAHKRTDVLGDCIACENCGRVNTLDERHNWSNSSWIAAVKKEWVI